LVFYTRPAVGRVMRRRGVRRGHGAIYGACSGRKRMKRGARVGACVLSQNSPL